MGFRTVASNDWDRSGTKLQVGSKKNISRRQLEKFKERAQNNLPFFAKYFCKRQHTPKQVEVGENLRTEKKSVSVFCRQGGKTTLFGDYDSHELTFRTYPDGDNDYTIVFAPIKDQSKLIFGKVYDIMTGNKFLYSQVAKATADEIVMTNGNKLRAMTASPNAHIRGHSPKKIQCDETQDITDVKYYEDILPSGAATDAKIQEIGTPAKRNHFWKTWKYDNSFEKVMQTWEECPFISKEYIMGLLKSGQMTKAKFDQEFNCIWNIDIGSAWPYELIQLMCVLEPGQNLARYDPQIKYYSGIDVGKSPAETVLSIGKGQGDDLYQVKLLRINKPDTFEEIINTLYGPVALYEPITCIDATSGSQGVPVYEGLVKKFKNDGNHIMTNRIIPEDYNVSRSYKADLAMDLEILGENNRLKLLNIEGQRRQMIGYEKKTTASGNTVFFSEDLNDICQADMLMVRAFIHHRNISTKFTYAASGSVGGYGNGVGKERFSFTRDLPNRPPEW